MRLKAREHFCRSYQLPVTASKGLHLMTFGKAELPEEGQEKIIAVNMAIAFSSSPGELWVQVLNSSNMKS